jgi:uncharacterized protein YbjQ (UPF0145 family)
MSTPPQAPPLQPGFLVSTLPVIPGKRITRHLGLVSGNTVRAKFFMRDIMAGLKQIIGGELKGYTELLQEARTEATGRMVEQARSLGANGVIQVRFSTSSLLQGAVEMYAYGTAVCLEDE